MKVSSKAAENPPSHPSGAAQCPNNAENGGFTRALSGGGTRHIFARMRPAVRRVTGGKSITSCAYSGADFARSVVSVSQRSTPVRLFRTRRHSYNVNTPRRIVMNPLSHDSRKRSIPSAFPRNTNSHAAPTKTAANAVTRGTPM